ncbi:MAG: BRO family protein [Eubacteriales bacterium]|uniref:BRO family protein n=1 Tax=Fenollaria sp. TaxID=1965292 RepID=UPI002A753988|nr:BRO family protein [Fenollaria sp.]MDD7339970.1 BRO family protein [Eubacteriales bacterium]MDY3105436.1 BRO family protein [Fenollaria sp.]
MDNEIKLFEGRQIRSAWDNEKEEWYFSIIDILGVLTESDNPRKYWSVLKTRLKNEGNELATNCSQLKMEAADGKMRETDVADMQGIFRIIQSVPSPKAEPFKMWLAEVGKERIDEIIDPELTIDRALDTYLKKGYSREWINQRLQAIQVRKELTDTWQDHGVKAGKEYAILTNEISKAWSGMTTREYKNLKGLKKENLRDNMSTLEIVLNMLAEATTTELTKTKNPQGLDENKKVAKDGGSIAGNARKEIEKETGQPVITSKNAIDFAKLIDDVSNKISNIEDSENRK